MAVTNYIWDVENDRYLMETDEAGATTHAYTIEPAKHGNLVSQRRGGTTSFYHYDALGSTRALTNAANAVTDTNMYDAWGVNVASTGTTENPFRWVGQLQYYRDEPSGQFSIALRNYGPFVGRWLSAAPLGRATDENHYAYASNSPLHSAAIAASGADSGTFDVLLGLCDLSEEYNECCCSSVQVKYFPTPEQQRRYQFIRLRVFVESRLIRSWCPFSGITPWHSDDPDDTEGGREMWMPKRPRRPAIWTDWPAFGPVEGYHAGRCPWYCRLDGLEQDFEVCAIGVVRGIGMTREILGCVRYGHSCRLTYREDSSASTCIASCRIACTVSQYGADTGITPSGPMHSPADPDVP